jgi:hypothetical protein
MSEFATEEDNGITDFLWSQQQDVYKPTTESWWCGCHSFSKSPNHLCKHLIRMYVGRDGLQSNKPPMPFYGEVWRQTRTPVLWIKGLHDSDQLAVRDLRPEAVSPILMGSPPPAALPDAPVDPAFATEPALYDSDDEEDEEDEEGDAEEKRSDADNEDQWVDFFDGFDFAENAEEFAEREMEGDAIKEKLDLMELQLESILDGVREAKTFPSGHRYLREIPRPDVRNIGAWIEHMDRLETVRRATVLPTTFGRARTGNIFADIL